MGEQRSAAFLAAMLETAVDAILVIDVHGVIQSCNAALQTLFGYTADELIGNSIELLMPAQYRGKHGAFIGQYLKTGKSKVVGGGLDLHGRRSDGELFPMHLTVSEFYVGGERYFAGVVRDISERIRVESTLRESDERLRRSLIFANIGTWDWDIKTGQLYWSERIGPLFGYPEGVLETSYENFLAAVHADDRQRVIDAVNACVAHGDEYEIEHRCVWPDGSVRWLLERGDVVRDHSGEAQRMLGIVQDITRLKEIDDDLIAAKEEAERANRAKSEFLSSMSHELRTPLNAIMGFAQLFDFDPSASQQQRQAASEIYRAGKHLRALIDDILDLAKIEAGQLQVSLEPLSLPGLAQECCTLIMPLAEKGEVTLLNEVSDCAGITLLADRTRLKQVLLNLLSNAVKYNRRQGRVALSCQALDDGYLRISVSDTGMGIAAEDMEYLFQPFRRLVAEQSDIEGTGIGLSITKQFVEMMGGRSGVESTLGQGSRFWVDLRISAAAAASERRVEPPEQAPPLRLSPARILVVEDNSTNRTVFTHQLQALGYTPTLAAGAHEVLARLKSKPFDLILTDIHMPAMDGYELARYVRAIEADSDRHTPIIAVTANVMAGERERCLAAGMDDYLSKPVDITLLGKTLRHWLGEAGGDEVMPVIAPAAQDAELPGLNLGRLAALLGDNIVHQQAVLRSFIENVPECMDQMRQSTRQQQADRLRFWAHRFKSSTRVIGAEALAQLCQSIEDFCLKDDWTRLKLLVAELETLVQQVVTRLGAVLREFDAAEALGDGVSGIYDKGTVLLLDDDPVLLQLLQISLADLGVKDVLTAVSGAQALARLDQSAGQVDVVFCDLNMPQMDGIEFLRNLAARGYRGAVVLLSGEESRILNSARQLANAYGFRFVAALEKPIGRAQLAYMLAKALGTKPARARREQSEVSIEELQQAISNDEFVVYYQPKVDVYNKSLVGVESLVRWLHPQKQFVMPDQFIPLAEEHGLIDELTDIVMEKSFAQLRQWREQGLDLTVSINIAVGTIGRRIRFPEIVMEFLQRHDLTPQDVVLELTEGGLMQDIAATLDALVRLRLKGVVLSIDDFGTGYSTFRQLQGIPFSELKIDREFVSTAISDPASRAILESSVLLGQKLGMKLVAEGVESEREWGLLKKLGCHQIQGYFVAKPMRAEELTPWLQQWKQNLAET